MNVLSMQSSSLDLDTPLTPSQVDTYYRPLCPPGLSVTFVSKDRGKVLISTTPRPKDSIVLNEKPLLVWQHLSSRLSSFCCSNCLRYLNSTVNIPSNIDKACSKIFNVDNGSNLLHLPIAISCPYGCQEVYCSDTCVSDAWDTYHALLCPGIMTLESATALAKFSELAASSNDTLFLVARAISYIAYNADRHNGNLILGYAPLRPFVKCAWEIVCNTDQVVELCVDVATLLSDIMIEKRQQYPSLFSGAVVSRLMGMFEMNNLEVIIEHPLSILLDLLCIKFSYASIESYLKMKSKDVLSSDVCRLLDRMQAVSNQYFDDHDNDTCHEEQEADDVDDGEEECTKESCPLLYFPPCEGTALYTIACTMNHSCVPNCHLYKSLTDKDAAAVIIAIRAIEANEELNICYLDDDDDVSVLEQTYRFKCTCLKCG